MTISDKYVISTVWLYHSRSKKLYWIRKMCLFLRKHFLHKHDFSFHSPLSLRAKMSKICIAPKHGTEMEAKEFFLRGLKLLSEEWKNSRGLGRYFPLFFLSYQSIEHYLFYLAHSFGLSHVILLHPLLKA